jgi:RNA polymerase sigma-70 factor (ECF subfamily)
MGTDAKGLDARDLFEVLVRENEAMLKIYLRSAMHDRTATEDLFQDTLLVAWEKLDRFDRTQPFGPWLRGIAAKLVLAHHRRQSKTTFLCNDKILEALDNRMMALHRQPGGTLEEKIAFLNECLDLLPELLRETIEQRYFLELSRQEMAERLGITEEAVKKRLQRARTDLLECMLRKLSQGGPDA